MLSNRILLNIVGILLIGASIAGAGLYEEPPPKILPGIFLFQYAEHSGEKDSQWTTSQDRNGATTHTGTLDLSPYTNLTSISFQGRYSSSCTPSRFCNDPEISVTIKDPAGKTAFSEVVRGNSGSFAFNYETDVPVPEDWTTEKDTEDEAVEEETEKHPPSKVGSGKWTITLTEDRGQMFIDSETDGTLLIDWTFYDATVVVEKEPRAIEMKGHSYSYQYAVAV